MGGCEGRLNSDEPVAGVKEEPWGGATTTRNQGSTAAPGFLLHAGSVHPSAEGLTLCRKVAIRKQDSQMCP